MKLFNKSILKIGLFVAVFSLGSCEDFLDINKDPNFPTDVPLSQLLPTIQVRIGTATDHSTGLSRFAHNYMQYTTIRGNINHNIITGNDYEATAPWDRAYLTLLTDVRQLIAKGNETENWHYVGIGQIIRAYIFSILVDYYGDVPYFNSNQGSLEPTPAFDSGADIYADLFLQLDEGIANLAKSSPMTPSNDDVIYGGDLDKWRKFAKTLKLKMYNTIREAPGMNVSASVQALLSEGDLISSPDEDFKIQYGNSTAPDDRNPGYTIEYAVGSHTNVNPYFYEVLMNKNTFGHGGNIFARRDPRIPYYFYNQMVPGEDPSNPPAYIDKSTGFLSIYSFSYNIDPDEGHDQATFQTVMGLFAVGGRYDEGNGLTINFNGYGAGPLRLLTYTHRLFIEAELAAVGVTNGDAQALLEDAVQAAFDDVNAIASAAGAPAIPQAAIDQYIPAVEAAYTVNPLQTIITQKWIASFGCPIDSYSDLRRTGYPVLHDGNTDTKIQTERTREWIVSLPYSNADLDLYENPPAQRNPYLSRVFWDID